MDWQLPASSIDLPRQEYWRLLYFQGIFPYPGIKLGLPYTSGRFFTDWSQRETHDHQGARQLQIKTYSSHLHQLLQLLDFQQHPPKERWEWEMEALSPREYLARQVLRYNFRNASDSYESNFISSYLENKLHMMTGLSLLIKTIHNKCLLK